MSDDGSSPRQVTNVTGDQVVYLTQHEWASGGLSVVSGVVQVPRSLVSGVGVSVTGARCLMSRELSQHLRHQYLCLDTGKGFPSLAALVDHSQHNVNISDTIEPQAEYNTENPLDNSELENSLGLDVEDDSQEHDFSSPIVDGKIKDINKEDKYRIELRSYMHKEQFKDCADEVPTLDKPFQCKECNKTFERAHDLWGHHASFRGPAFKCNYKDCQDTFLRLSDFAVHYSRHGGLDLVIPTDPGAKKVLNITCPICGIIITGGV